MEEIEVFAIFGTEEFSSAKVGEDILNSKYYEDYDKGGYNRLSEMIKQYMLEVLGIEVEERELREEPLYGWNARDAFLSELYNHVCYG